MILEGPAGGACFWSNLHRSSWRLRGAVVMGRVAGALGSVLLGLAVITPDGAAANPIGGCKFTVKRMQFAGDAKTQTACLLRKVKKKGAGASKQAIPSWLLSRVWTAVDINSDQVQRYLSDNSIDTEQVGGPIRKGDASSLGNFVIHDTSSPELTGVTTFPANIDDAAYGGNRLTGWAGLSSRVHLIIGRDGASRTIVDWKSPRTKPATKLEQTNLAGGARKLFAHVENVQPRIKPAGSWAWIAPEPGFSPAQEKRLALAYVVASLRAGRWLIPAYHFNIDQGLPDVHDDPQNADLGRWVGVVEAVVAEIAKAGS